MHHFEVPVIVVFTKYDQLLNNIAMHMDDYPNSYPDRSESEVAALAVKLFQEHYIHPLGDDIRYVQLESGYIDNADSVVC